MFQVQELDTKNRATYDVRKVAGRRYVMRILLMYYGG